MKTILIAGFCVLISLNGAFAGEDEARKLFFNPVPASASKALIGNNSSNSVISPDTAPGVDLSPENIGGLGGIGGYYEKLENQGISSWVELQRVGAVSTKRVDPNHVFKSGDKIRIHITTNGDGFLHALHKGSSGTMKMIPISDGGSVQTGIGSVIPSSGGWLKFDKNVGIERIDLLYGSHSQASELNMVPGPTNKPEKLTVTVRDIVDRYVASKGLVTFAQNGTKDLVVINQSGGSQALGVTPVAVQVPINRNSLSSVQATEAVYNAPAQYAVNRASEPVVMSLNLKHQ